MNFYLRKYNIDSINAHVIMLDIESEKEETLNTWLCHHSSQSYSLQTYRFTTSIRARYNYNMSFIRYQEVNRYWLWLAFVQSSNLPIKSALSWVKMIIRCMISTRKPFFLTKALESHKVTHNIKYLKYKKYFLISIV